MQNFAPGLSPAHENPFRTSCLLSLPASWHDTTPEALLTRWRAAGRRGALVGPHGTGKTMRLRALAARLADEGWRVAWVRWRDDGTSEPADWRAALAAADPESLLCLDGAESLGPLALYRVRRYTRRAGGLLATLHRASPFLPVLARHAPDPALFATHAELLRPGAAEAARAAFAAARGNAHEAFRRLYLGR